jgi:hypothetical protein
LKPIAKRLLCTPNIFGDHRQTSQENGQTLGVTKTSYHDDILQTWVGIGTQLDGLGHIGIDNVFYNCTPGIEVTGISGLKKFGIETFPGVATVL